MDQKGDEVKKKASNVGGLRNKADLVARTSQLYSETNILSFHDPTNPTVNQIVALRITRLNMPCEQDGAVGFLDDIINIAVAREFKRERRIYNPIRFEHRYPGIGGIDICVLHIPDKCNAIGKRTNNFVHLIALYCESLIYNPVVTQAD